VWTTPIVPLLDGILVVVALELVHR
jgi:hypothetical protein